jgi:hypothetical protein
VLDLKIEDLETTFFPWSEHQILFQGGRFLLPDELIYDGTKSIEKRSSRAEYSEIIPYLG